MGADLWGLRKNSGSWPLSRLDCDCRQPQGAVMNAANHISLISTNATMIVHEIATILGCFSQQWLSS